MKTITSEVHATDFQLSVEVLTLDDSPSDTTDSPTTDEPVVDLTNDMPDNPLISDADQQALLLLGATNDDFWLNFKWADHQSGDGGINGWGIHDMPDASFNWNNVGPLTHPQETVEASQIYHFTDEGALAFDAELTNGTDLHTAIQDVVAYMEAQVPIGGPMVDSPGVHVISTPPMDFMAH